MVGPHRFLGIVSYNLGKEFRFGFPRSQEESGAPDADGTGGSGDEDCGATSERPLDDVSGADHINLGGEGKECGMFFVKSDIGRSAKYSDVGVLKSRRRPWVCKTSDNRLFICDIGSDELDKDSGSMSEIGPGGGSNVQNTNVLRIFSSGQQVVDDPTPQKT